jgi:hypothetical protein
MLTNPYIGQCAESACYEKHDAESASLCSTVLPWVSLQRSNIVS